VSPEQQKLRAIRAWANPRKRVAVELRERATGAASPEAAELKTWAARLCALARKECERATEAPGAWVA
jgi:hypothetical protein